MKYSSHDLDLFWLSDAPRPMPIMRHPSVPAYRVGEPLQQGRRNWPVGTQYSYGLKGHELTLFLHQIDERLIQDIRYAEAEFAVITKHPVIVLAYRFGQSIPWSDVPFCLYMQPPHARAIPPPETSGQTRALLWVTLVGAFDGIIHAQRGMTLAPEFTLTLHNAIRHQAGMSFSPDECLSSISDLLVTYPDTNSRLLLAQARTIANL